MSQTKIEPNPETASGEKRIVNDFSITFGTINGSGSATANTTLLRALFKMGIPVSGKNIFPSNIKGMPTWYSIRANKNGFLARKEENDIVVAMNLATIQKDVASVKTGGVLFYSDDLLISNDRQDIIKYPMPIRSLVNEADVPAKIRNYVKNMIYVGILVRMLEIDMECIREALDFHFMGNEKAMSLNMKVVSLAYDWADQNLQKNDPYIVRKMDGTEGCIMGDGNTSGALGSAYGGVQFSAWYPITPATSLPESLNQVLPEIRKDPETGKDTFAVVQAEDELSAIGMSIGAGWGGLRSMTATSGPGLSLMAEYLGLAYYAEIPVVVWDVQRMGPSTGLPTRTSQGDITEAYFLSHGDTQFVMLFPSSIQECFEFGWRSLNISEQLQTPVLVMSDLDLGMNQWMGKAFEYPDEPIERGKILWEDDLEEILQARNGDWGRYLDIDGDGIPYRTVAGNRHPKSSYFSRGTGHNDYGKYSEDPDNWEKLMKRLQLKFKTALKFLPEQEIESSDGAEIGIIAYGSTELAVKEARVLLAQNGIKTDFLRIRSIPFNHQVKDFILQHQKNYVVEINDVGQMNQILTLAYPQHTDRLFSVAKNNGLPLSAESIINMIQAWEEK